MNRSQTGVSRILRGRIYGAESEDRGEKYYLVVSNNQRNARLDTFLAVRLTTSREPPLPSVVYLTQVDAPGTGAIPADDLDKVYRNEVTRDYGALAPATMRRVDDALRAALAI